MLSGFLCVRSDCHSALPASSVQSSECRGRAGKPSLLFIKQIELAPKGPWPVASSHTRVLWLILAPCCLCGRKWGRGEEARLCRKPRGSTPGTHVLSSLRWKMPVCAPPPPHPQTRTIWQINSAPVGHTTAADREKQGRLLCAGS